MQAKFAHIVCVSAHRVRARANGMTAYLGWWRFYGSYRGEA
jgi:hypothetical protein